MESLKSDMPQIVLIDACGWVAIAEAKINFDTELAREIGNPSLLLLDEVLHELRNLETQKRGLLLSLLEERCEKPPEYLSTILEMFDDTDDCLIEAARILNADVLTIDVDLKRRLFNEGLNYIEVVGEKRLRRRTLNS